jgi:hypothetical protein
MDNEVATYYDHHVIEFSCAGVVFLRVHPHGKRDSKRPEERARARLLNRDRAVLLSRKHRELFRVVALGK